MASINFQKVTVRQVLSRVAQTAITFLLLGGLLFLGAWRLDWAEAWAFIGVYFLVGLAGTLWVLYHDPGLSNERASVKKGAKRWDQVVVGIYTALTLVLFLAIGLDAGRFGWSSVPAWARVLGGLGFIPSFGLSLWASYVNTYLSARVRIQAERDHHAVTTGPYRIVRHPMYLGMLILDVCLPLLLGSWWALVVSGVMIAVLVLRTSKEDRMLQAELPGYMDLVKQTKYRLVPGIW